MKQVRAVVVRSAMAVLLAVTLPAWALAAEETAAPSPEAQQEPAAAPEASQEQTVTPPPDEQLVDPDAVDQLKPAGEIGGRNALPDKPVDLESRQPVVKEKEQLDFIELEGYFRLRWDLFHQLDMGAIASLKEVCLEVDGATSNKCSRVTMGTNMRLSVRPTLNVSEDIRIKSRIDLLDNVVLGSTSDTYNVNNSSPNYAGFSGFSSTQLSPSAGQNSSVDAIQVKELYGEVRIPIGLIRFGRQASDWGMGMYVNDGSGLDDDYGDFVDRVAFATKVFEHAMFFTWDFPSSGLTMHNSLIPVGQDKNPTIDDDAWQWTFGVARKDTREEIDEKLANDEIVLNYGMINVFRTQEYDITASETYLVDSFGTEADRNGVAMVPRDLFLYVGDVWFKLLWRDLHFELEGAIIKGDVGNISVNGGDQKMSVDLLQYGLVLQLDYAFLDRTLMAGLEYGLASGDPDPGWGIYPIIPGKDHYSGATQYDMDQKITNFRFDPDYHVDLILFREVLGTVSDATYIKLMTEYKPVPMFGVRLEGIFSFVLEPDSSPYYDINPMSDGINMNSSRQLGIELDLHLYYRSLADNFYAGLSYGVLFPGKALGRVYRGTTTDGAETINWDPANDVAQTVQAMLSIMF